VIVKVGVTVSVFVAVPVGVTVAVRVLVPVAVDVGVTVGVFVAVPVGVTVAVVVLVRVAVDVGVLVDVGVGVGVRPTTIFPLPGVHGTGVSKAPGMILKLHCASCSGLFPLACPWKVTLTILIGGAGFTAGRHAHEQTTLPTGGVGAGVVHGAKQPVSNGA
jgi:hypothetical protein